MYWNAKIILLLLGIAILQVIAQENEESETTTIKISNEASPKKDIEKALDSKLRTALLKALTDLENEGADTKKQKDSNDDDEADVKRAQASSITIFANENDDSESGSDESVSSSEEQSKKTDSKPTLDESEITEPTTESEEDPSKQKAEIVVFQKSDALSSRTITSLEKNPLDPLKEAEHFITSASNSFVSKNEPTIEPTKNKIVNYSNLNTITNSESRKPSKTTIVEKFSIGKAVEEPDYIKTYVRPLGLNVNSDVSSTPSNSVINDFKSGKSDDEANENSSDGEAVTQSAIEVSTEENEAKVEQVQFFSAPLVAAFTVHQDEKGQPNKVEPIYKNGLDSKKQEPIPTQKPTTNPQPSQSILQSSLFNSLGLQQKQQILEQELEKLRNQQNNNLLSQNFNNLDSHIQRFTQTGFNQAINQNFNQFDPVFTEPDRSIVTKLATIDPSNLLEQNVGPILNRFMPNEAIVPRLNNVQTNNPNQIVQETKPSFQSGAVSLIPSISFDPLIEAGKLPKNAQILPNKEPRGFHSFVKLPTIINNGPNFVTPIPGFIDTRPQQNPNSLNQNAINQAGLNIIRPTLNSLDNQPNRFPFQSNQVSNQNRFLRQEQDANSLSFNQNTFSIVPAHQPFGPKHELGYFPDNNRFLRQNEASLAQPQQIQDTRLFRSNQAQNNGFQGFNTNAQNQKGFVRSSFDGNPPKIQIQQSVQPFETSNRFFKSSGLNLNDAQKFTQNNRFLRSNQEGVGFFQTPLLQNYRYSNSFGFPAIPLN